MTDTQDEKTTTLAGKTRQLFALKPAELEAKGLPPTRAVEKAEGTTLGWAVTGVGLLLMLGSLVTGVLIVLGDRDISLMVVILVAIPGVAGLPVSLVGAGMISRDASPIMDKLGSIAEKLIRARRGNGAT